MSYVPGQKHDLFFSYAHADNGAWLEAFQKTLCEGLNERLGSRVSVWQDEHNLRLGMNWKNEIREAICGAAAFLAVCSPSYFNSFWCRDERKLFLAHHNAEESLDPIRVGEVYRFLKIIKTPAENDLLFKVLPALQSVNFFCPAASDSETEFLPGTPEFRAKVKQAVLAVAALLRAMRRSREAIYVATAADDVTDEWRICRNEQDRGFDIVTIYGENPTGTVPTSPFPGSSDHIVRSVVLAILPDSTRPRGIDGRARTGRGSFHHWPLGTPLRS
jgi:hypothetical protein